MDNCRLLMIYFTVFHVVACAKVFGLLQGTVAHIIDTATLIPIAIGCSYSFGRSRPAQLTRLDLAVLVYLFVSLASFVAYFLPSNPCEMKAYLYGIHLFVLPIFLYFAAKSLNTPQQFRLLRFLCILHTFAMCLGFYWHIMQPDYYRSYLAVEALGVFDKLEDWQLFHRLGSYFGSTSMGSIAAITIALCVLSEFRSATWTRMMIATMFLGALLTHQRGGFVASALALAYVIISRPNSQVKKHNQVFAIAVCAACVVGGVSLFDYLREGTLDQMLSRYTGELTEGVTGVAKERGYGPGFAYLADFPLGVGLGATSSAADAAGLTRRGQVVDANFMRILSDLGIQGLVSFLFVLLIASCAALRKNRPQGWIVLIGSISIICLVTNTLDQVYIPHMFWFVLGCIDTPDRVNSIAKCGPRQATCAAFRLANRNAIDQIPQLTSRHRC